LNLAAIWAKIAELNTIVESQQFSADHNAKIVDAFMAGDQWLQNMLEKQAGFQIYSVMTYLDNKGTCRVWCPGSKGSRRGPGELGLTTRVNQVRAAFQNCTVYFGK
jgi:hypothetical protein